MGRIAPASKDAALGYWLDTGLCVADGDVEGLGRAVGTLARTPPAAWDNPRRRAWAGQRQNLARPFYDLLSSAATADRARRP